MDDHTTSAAPNPDPMPSLQRRVVAGLVDLVMVALIASAAAVVTATRVPAILQPDGSVGFTDADRRLLDALSGPLARGHLWGDTLWAYSTVDAVTIVGTAVVAGLLVGAFVPRLAGGRSPGKLLFRMQVVTVEGQPPGLLRHIVRTVASPADLMPLVVPGLTGFAFAASNPRRQRIGDRLAGTIVVNRQVTDDMVSAAEALAPRDQSAPTRAPKAEFVPTIRSATLVDHAPTRTDTSLNRRPEPPDLDGYRAARLYQAPVRAGATPAGRNDVPKPQTHGDTVEMNERSSAPEQPAPELTASPVPVEERSNNPYPKPVRRSRDMTEDAQLPDFDSLTLPESSLSDMPLTNNALLEALGLTPPDDNRVDAGSEPTAHTAPAGHNPPAVPAVESPAADERPRATPPARLPKRSSGGARAKPTEARAAAVMAPAPTATARQGSSAAPDKRAPIWSEDWDAWIYWDTTLETWFRHDMQRGTWVPLDDG